MKSSCSQICELAYTENLIAIVLAYFSPLRVVGATRELSMECCSKTECCGGIRGTALAPGWLHGERKRRSRLGGHV
jgi:hypothetical protein